MKNYIGTEIGKFQILNQKRENNKTYLYCKCNKCGKIRWIAQAHVKTTKCCESKSFTTQFKPLVPESKIVNDIELIEPVGKKRTCIVWKCKCFCGNIFYASFTKIKRKEIKSCGCANKRYTPENLQKAIKTFKEKNLKEGTSLSAIRSKLISTNTSGKTGVIWNKAKNKWIATIIFKGKRHYLGGYTKKENAVNARKEAEEEYFKPILDKYTKKEPN